MPRAVQPLGVTLESVNLLYVPAVDVGRRLTRIIHRVEIKRLRGGRYGLDGAVAALTTTVSRAWNAVFIVHGHVRGAGGDAGQT